jgi:hypothetical protein
MEPTASPLVHFGIPALAAVVAVLFVLGAGYAGRAPGDREAAMSSPGRRAALRAALGVSALFAVSGALALRGVLADASRRPPALMPLVLLCLVTTTVVAFSALGGRIAARVPLWALVGAQGFRLPLELVMHRAAREGVMPVEMSFSGYNFDVVTGATALVLGALLYRGAAPRVVVALWNAMGALLLLNVVTIAVSLLPWFHAFGPAHVNTWVLYFPYVWLPTVLVPAALFGHLVVLRRLRMLHAAPGGSPVHAGAGRALLPRP